MMIRQGVRIEAVQQYAIQHECNLLIATDSVNDAVVQCATAIEKRGICGTEILDLWERLTDLPQIFLLDMIA